MQLPWDAPAPVTGDKEAAAADKPVPHRVSSDNVLQPSAIGARRSFQKSRRNSGEDSEEKEVDKVPPPPLPSAKHLPRRSSFFLFWNKISKLLCC
jgi:hypothetical protein